MQALHHLAGGTGVGYKNAHILWPHSCSISKLNVQILRITGGLANADQLIIQVLRYQRRCIHSEQPHTVRLDDFPRGTLHNGGIQQLHCVLNSADAAGFHRVRHLSDGVIVPDISKESAALPLGSGSVGLVQLVEQGFFHILQAVKADVLAQPHPGHLSGIGLFGQLGNGQHKHAVHMA